MASPQTPTRSLSPITELTTPNSYRTLILPSIEGGESEDDVRSLRSKSSGGTIRLSQTDHALQSLGKSIQSFVSEAPLPRQSNPTSPPSATVKRERRRSGIPVKVDSPKRPVSSSVPFPTQTPPRPGGLLPPPRSVSAGKPVAKTPASPPSPASPYGQVSDEARRRYIERYYPNSKEAKDRREQDAKKKEAEEAAAREKEKAAQEKKARDEQIEKKLKERRRSIKFGDETKVEVKPEPEPQLEPKARPELDESAVASTPELAPVADEPVNNMAGVGASDFSVRQRRSSRPNSMYASAPNSRAPSPLKGSFSDVNLADLHRVPSFTAVNRRPSFTSVPDGHPTLHNIPVFQEDVYLEMGARRKGWSPRSSLQSLPLSTARPRPPTAGPMKKRPHSFMIFRPTSGMQRSRSYSGAPSEPVAPPLKTPPATAAATPIASPMSKHQRQKSLSTDHLPPQNPVKANRHSIHSISVPSQPPSTASATVSNTTVSNATVSNPVVSNPTVSNSTVSNATVGDTTASRRSSVDASRRASVDRNPPGLTRASSILSSIFGSKPPTTLEPKASRKELPRKSSKRLSKKAPSPSPNPQSPLPLLGELTPEEKSGASTPLAIRTSGIFGIRDDGSDVFRVSHDSDPKTPPSAFDPKSIRSLQDCTGSPHTQSDRVKRVLYVENHVPSPDDPKEITPDQQPLPLPEINTDPKAEEEFHTPMSPLSPSWTREPEPLGTTLVDLPQQTVAEALNVPSFPPAVTIVDGQLLSQSGSSGHSSSDHEHGQPGSFSPQRALSTPSPDQDLSSELYTTPVMIDEAIQTSVQPSPVSPTRPSRPLPRPPSRPASTSPRSHLSAPRPTFIPPPAPSSSPTPDLPILIASHLLSTHAATLLRHSGEMVGSSEVMRKMARESLEWGGILMGMAEKMTKKQQEEHRVEGVPRLRSGTPLAFDTLLRSSSRSSQGHGHGHDGMTRSRSSLTVDHVHSAYGSVTSSPTPTPVAQRVSFESKQGRRPMDSLEEVHKLGQQGLVNVHAAEEAWAVAMKHLAHAVEGGLAVAGVQEKERKEVSEQTAGANEWSANTIAPSESSEAVRPNLQHHAHSSVLSYPRGSDGGPSQPASPYSQPATYPGIDQQTSFLNKAPSPESETFTQSERDSTIKRRRMTIQGTPNSHAYANPVNRPVGTTPRAVSAAAAPSSGPGYTDEQLQLDPSLPSPPLPTSIRRANTLAVRSPEARRARLESNDSQRAKAEMGSQGPKSSLTKGSGRKLVKKEKENRAQVEEPGSLDRNSVVIGRKKHWWSRRGSIVVR
ncbi:hypothetical protein IAR50_006023 [Cryptococcus sp. DSM 104548]